MGSVVLIALALIILPVIFDGQGSYEGEITSRIPDAPIIETLTPPIPTRPVVLSQQPDFSTDSSISPQPQVADDQAVADVVDASAEDAAAAEENLAAVVTSQPSFVREAPELGADGLPQGWSVRLGTFSDARNAQALLEKLLDAGYKAYQKELEREQGVLTAVLVGPWLDRSRVDQYQKELQAQFQLAGIVERYTIDGL